MAHADRITSKPEGNPAGVVQAALLDRGLTRRVSFMYPYDWDIDEPVRFEVLEPFAAFTDRPLTRHPVPLWSRRVTNALCALGGFEARLYEVLLVDTSGNPVAHAQDYVLFHLRTVIDVLDPKRSVYQRYPASAGRAAGKVSVVEKLVLSTSDLPTCFFVQEALHRACC